MTKSEQESSGERKEGRKEERKEERKECIKKEKKVERRDKIRLTTLISSASILKLCTQRYFCRSFQDLHIDLSNSIH